MRDDKGSRTARTDGGRKWTAVERAYWVPPARGTVTLAARLRARAVSLGLKYREERAERGAFTAHLALADGREAFTFGFTRQALVALCVDDLGYRWAAAKRIAALPCRLTGAIIPFTPHARAVARLLASRGKEVFLHMPMEPAYRLPVVPEYADAIRSGQTPAEVREKLFRCLGSVPGATGLNNHEGSKVTEDRPLMDAVMAAVKERELVFLDSGTSTRSVAWRAARDAGLRWAKRTVFLDDPMPRPQVEEAFARLVQEARRTGAAIGIGHPHPSTLDVLERRVPEVEAAGIVFVPVSALANAP